MLTPETVTTPEDCTRTDNTRPTTRQRGSERAAHCTAWVNHAYPASGATESLSMIKPRTIIPMANRAPPMVCSLTLAVRPFAVITATICATPSTYSTASLMSSITTKRISTDPTLPPSRIGSARRQVRRPDLNMPMEMNVSAGMDCVMAPAIVPQAHPDQRLPVQRDALIRKRRLANDLRCSERSLAPMKNSPMPPAMPPTIAIISTFPHLSDRADRRCLPDAPPRGHN